MEKNPTISVLMDLYNEITHQHLAEQKKNVPCAIKLLTLSKIIENLHFVLDYLESTTSKNV